MILRRVWIVTVIFALVEPVGLASAARLLQGQVLENHDGTTRPAANAQVWIVNVGNPYTTQDDGGYRVLVPDAIRVNQEITLFVKRKEWFIATPVGVNLNCPQVSTQTSSCPLNHRRNPCLPCNSPNWSRVCPRN